MSKQILLSLLNCSWQWMLLSGLIWFVTSSMFRKSRRSNTTVHLLWLLSLLSLPILFGLNQFVPALSIAGDPVPELTQAKPINVSGLAALPTDLPEISSTENNTQSENQLFAGGKSLVNWTKMDFLLCVWAIGALAMFVRFTFGLSRIYQLRRSAVVADDSYQAICRRLARQLDIKRPVTVCFSDRIASPISFGWLSPSVLMPRKLDLEQFALVAAHELAHVQRLDWLTNLFSHLVGVIFFFHPIYHLLNRELVHLRERICDDWVIQLTGARKNYAQCLLDLVRHRDRAIPLALSLNQPSQLESRIDTILKNNRRLDVQLKPRLRLMVATLLLTCLPLLAMAQLVPLKTFQVSLFAQTPEKSEKAVDKTAEKQDMGKTKAGKMAGKQYKDESYITVKAPVLLEPSEENRIFSGPQPGEKLSPLTVTGIGGKIDGTTFDMTTKADGKPLVLFLQDTNAVGIKGLVNVFELLLQIDAFQKRQSQATGTEMPNQGLQIGVVFLADNLDTLPEWARNMLKEEIPNAVLKGISPDGREGPGSYGLNRNVAQTVLIAEDGQVLHNFAFTQPMLYTDPHFLGAIAQAIEVAPATLEKWLNEASANRHYEKKVKAVIIKEGDDISGDAPEWVELRNLTDEELNMKGWIFNLVTTELDTERKLIRFTNHVEIPAGKVKYVIINDSDGTSGDTPDWMELRNPTDGDTSEWLELHNPTDKELNLKGWALEIVPTVLDTKGKRIRFTNDVKIPPDGVLLLVRDPKSLKKSGIILEEDEQPQKEKKERGRTMEKDGARDRERMSSREELVKRFDKDGDGKLNAEEGMAARRALANRASQNRNRRANVEVKNPAEFKKVQGATLFSGPQPGEKLPPLMATGIRGRAKGKTFDFIAKTDDGKPLVLFLQDGNVTGLHGLIGISQMIEKIANKSKQKLHMRAVFLGDDPKTLKRSVLQWINSSISVETDDPNMPAGSVTVSPISLRMPENVLLGISPDGREGPGNYGLDRNVAQTVIIAKDGKVLHNFAFTQPMRSNDPHVLGAIAQAIGEDPASVEKWLNEAPAEDARTERDRRQMEDKSNHTEELQKQLNTLRERLQRLNETVAKTKGKEDRLDQVEELLEQLNADVKILRRMQKSISPAKTKGKEDRLDQVEELVKQLNANLEALLRINKRASAAKRKNENRYSRSNVEVKNPAEFKKTQGTAIFSGPQPGEKLPPLKAKGINGETQGKTYDVIAKADGQLLVLFLQDESGLGLRGLLGISRLLARIAEKSEQTMHISAVFLGDTPDTVESQVSRLVPHIPSEVLLGISQDGREGPGSYGLNRNVAQTVIIAKDGKVLHNFAFTQPMLRPDPYVLGAVGEAIGIKPATLEKWLNPQNPVIEIKNPAEGGKTGEMRLNGNIVQFDELPGRLLNLSEEQKSTLIIQSERDVPHEQIVKVMDIAKEAGIDKIEFAMRPSENKRMESGREQMRRGKEE
ncbi:MAG: biopolymer transporter ExbD [Candidatus Poribacteria bacterium]|nr:biopolymer transporter ExbD [Candidatus Poribacteria bacterium]